MKNQKGFNLLELIIVIAVIAVIVGLFIGFFGFAINDAEDAKAALENQGYSNVRNVQRHYFGSSMVYGCSEDDTFAFTADAENANQKTVNVTVCSGLIAKGFTVRTR